MNAIRARLIVLAALALARLGAWGLGDPGTEAEYELRRWLDCALDLVLLALDGWVERRQVSRIRAPANDATRGASDEAEKDTHPPEDAAERGGLAPRP